MAIFYNKKQLSEIEFIEKERVFIITDENKDYYLYIPYIPNFETDNYKPDNFYLFLFENNHLNAENDVFQLYDKDKEKRIGWIFPISILDSNENDYTDNEHLNKYKLLAYKKLLSKNVSYKINIEEINKEVNISEIFGEDTIVALFSKKEINKNDFRIKSYYPSLATYGYYIKNKNKLTVKYPTGDYLDTFRRNKRLYLKYVNNRISSMEFITQLYENYLKELDHHLIRFHLLYQVVEYLISDKFSADFELLLKKYKNKQITKNNFIEEINNIRNERKNIRDIFGDLNFTDNSFEGNVKIDLKRDIKDFLRELNVDGKENIGDLIYDTRNIIVHNYRKIKNENFELLDRITYEFEILVNYLIINLPSFYN